MALEPTWSPTQQARLDQWRVPRCVDVHCHCLPSLDDGPEDLEGALDLCEALVADGITTVIATPHQLGVYDGYNSPAEVRDAVAALVRELEICDISLELTVGADVRVDERLVRLIEADEVLTVADARRHLLLELPHQVPVDPLPVIKSLSDVGIQTIMTHPERHKYLAGQVDRIAAWVDAGARLQITAGSLLGDFGALANQEAWRLVHAGLVSLVATDAHNHDRRPPRLSPALAALEVEVGADLARALCLDNPLRVYRGEPIAAPKRGAP